MTSRRQPRTTTPACRKCGWTGRTTTAGIAGRSTRIHSCDRHLAALAATARGNARAAAVDRTPKPCLHKVAAHTHATYACYVLDTCRCTPCSAANATYEANRKRLQAYGRFDAFIDAAPARTHLRALSAAGMGWKRVAHLAGLPTSNVYPILWGRRDRRGGAPRARARRTLVEAILAVPMPTLDYLAPGALTDSTGTRRRIQALVTRGWSVKRIASAATPPLDRQPLDHALTHPTVIVRTALAVRAVYDDLWDQAPPTITTGDKIATARSLHRAEAAGWVPPLAWDDDTIDDPTATPGVEATPGGVDEIAIARALSGDRATLTRAERWLIVEQLAALGHSDAQIADRVAMTSRTIERDRRTLAIASRWSA